MVCAGAGTTVDRLSPLLCVGSGPDEIRASQPWIDELVYEPLLRRGVRMLHHEREPAPGVDVAEDLTDPTFLERLDEVETRSVMCCYVLEHIHHLRSLAFALPKLVASPATAPS
jgi:hypothetical protein